MTNTGVFEVKEDKIEELKIQKDMWKFHCVGRLF